MQLQQRAAGRCAAGPQGGPCSCSNEQQAGALQGHKAGPCSCSNEQQAGALQGHRAGPCSCSSEQQAGARRGHRAGPCSCSNEQQAGARQGHRAGPCNCSNEQQTGVRQGHRAGPCSYNSDCSRAANGTAAATTATATRPGSINGSNWISPLLSVGWVWKLLLQGHKAGPEVEAQSAERAHHWIEVAGHTLVALGPILRDEGRGEAKNA